MTLTARHPGAERGLDATARRNPPSLRTVAAMCGLVVTWVLLWLAFWVAAPAALGWKPVVITSDSMAPAIHAGDIIVARPHSGIGLGAGTVVVFDPDDDRGLITHRIAIAHDNGTYTTSGDANATSDSTPLHPDQVVGVGALRVPYIGLPAVWVQQGSWDKFLVVLALLAGAVRLARPGSGPPPRGDREASTGAPVPEPAMPTAARSPSLPAGIRSAGGALLLIVVLFSVGAARGAFAGTTGNSNNSLTAWQPVYDVAVTALRAPASAGTNTTVTVEVDVANLGDDTTTFDVQLRDVTKGATIGTTSVTLGVGGTTTVSFSWTPGGPVGTRTLEAEAILASDADPTNNLATTTVNVTGGGGP